MPGKYPLKRLFERRRPEFHEKGNFTYRCRCRDEAARYYEERAPGLGLSFIEAVERSVDQIIANSEAYQLVGEDIRRKIMKGFPYSLLYAIESDRIRIMAVAHMKRRPGYWQYRL
jgi:plasmid stabilization system protein ParE